MKSAKGTSTSAAKLKARATLKDATKKSLDRMKKSELSTLCKDCGLSGEGIKDIMIDRLLGWRDGNGDNADSSVAKESVASKKSTTKVEAAQPSVEEEEEEEESVLSDIADLNLQDNVIPYNQLKKLELIGRGEFKNVYKGIYKEKTVAIAEITANLTEVDIGELRKLRGSRHSNIVKFIGISIPVQPSPVCVVMVYEYCAQGKLHDYIRSTPVPTFSVILGIMMGVSKALEFVHGRDPYIIHGEVQSYNVLINEAGIAKLMDSNFTKFRETSETYDDLAHPVNWDAPELFSAGGEYDDRIDVYSTGWVFWELLQWHNQKKEIPAEGCSEEWIKDVICVKNMRPCTAEMSEHWGSEIVSLMTSMWQRDSDLRPSITEVVEQLQNLIDADDA